MARLFNAIVFDEWEVSAAVAGVVYTSPAFNAMLGAADQFALHAVIDNCAATDTVSYILEYSEDGRNWLQYDEQPDLDVFPGAASNHYIFYSNRPNASLVRISLYLSPNVAKPHIRIHACGRGRTAPVPERDARGGTGLPSSHFKPPSFRSRAPGRALKSTPGEACCSECKGDKPCSAKGIDPSASGIVRDRKRTA